jgi:phosphoribosylformylglycinamidine synthase subunit PurS
MKYTAEIKVMPHKELLDPQGKTVANNLPNLDIHGVQDVRIGKHIVMHFEASSEAEAEEKVSSACKKLLANTIVETFEYTISSQS